MIIKSGKSNPGDVKNWQVLLSAGGAGGGGQLGGIAGQMSGTEITGQVLTAYIYQSMYSPFWTAKLIMNDANNLIVSKKLKTGDTITIVLETVNGKSITNGQKSFSFEVYKISGRHFENFMQLSYSIDLVDPKFIKNASTRSKASYKEKKEDEIVKDEAKKIDCTDIECDTSKNKLNFLVPCLSPLTTIQMMSKSASMSGKNDYLFFQTDSAKFKFKSLDRLYQTGPVAEFYMTPAQQTLKDSSSKDIMLEFFNYTIEDEDKLSNTYAGFEEAALSTFDFVKKKFEKKTDGVIGFQPKHEGMSDNGKTLIDFADSWYTGRKEALKIMQDLRMTLQVPGGVGGWDWLSKTVTIRLPSQQDLIPEKYDPDLDGKWLVTGVTHNIGHHNYLVNYELLKVKKEGAA